LNLGKIFPAFYCKPFVINIISFIKEDMILKIKSYKENKIYIKNKEEKFEKNDEEREIDEKKEDEEKKEEDSKDLLNIKFVDENINKLLSIN